MTISMIGLGKMGASAGTKSFAESQAKVWLLLAGTVAVPPALFVGLNSHLTIFSARALVMDHMLGSAAFRSAGRSSRCGRSWCSPWSSPRSSLSSCSGACCS